MWLEYGLQFRLSEESSYPVHTILHLLVETFELSGIYYTVSEVCLHGFVKLC